MANGYWTEHKKGGAIDNPNLPVPGYTMASGTVAFTGTAGTTTAAVRTDCQYVQIFADAAAYMGWVTAGGAVTAATAAAVMPANVPVVVAKNPNADSYISLITV